LEPHLDAYAHLTDPRKINVEILKLRLFLKRRIDPEKGCWIWTGCTDGDGLGLIKVRGVKVIVHRLALALWTGVVLNRNQLAISTCRTALCFHPEHREICSSSQRRRAAAKETKRGAK
jgi:hypothetical protein